MHSPVRICGGVLGRVAMMSPGASPAGIRVCGDLGAISDDGGDHRGGFGDFSECFNLALQHIGARYRIPPSSGPEGIS